MLNTQHLITFKALVETSSFTETAKRLELTQPAVSQHIQKLERCLGKPLLIRHGRSAELTEEGRLLLQYVNEVEACYENFKLAWQGNLESLKTDSMPANQNG